MRSSDSCAAVYRSTALRKLKTFLHSETNLTDIFENVGNNIDNTNMPVDAFSRLTLTLSTPEVIKKNTFRENLHNSYSPLEKKSERRRTENVIVQNVPCFPFLLNPHPKVSSLAQCLVTFFFFWGGGGVVTMILLWDVSLNTWYLQSFVYRLLETEGILAHLLS